MGHGRWRTEDWNDWAGRNTRGRSRAEVFTSRRMRPEFDPASVGMRESRDGADNPSSTPIILASDVTGSMGDVAHILMQDKLGVLVAEILQRRPVSDPHLMAMAVGDATCDSAPLQVTQFEADIRLADQMRHLYVEGGGGGNNGESYALPWLFAGTKTSTDAFEKRGKKGYLFSFGDEPILPIVRREEASRFLGLQLARDVSAGECLALAQRGYEVFHILLRTGYSGHASGLDAAERTWRPLLGERLVILDDYRNVAELVVSLIQVNEGARPEDAANSWRDASAASSVRAALGLRSGRGHGFLNLFR